MRDVAGGRSGTRRWSAARGGDGYGWFDWLGCVDEIGVSDELRVVLSLRRLDEPGAPELLLACRVPRSAPRLESVRDLFAGAAWHEREAADEFGLELDGGDPRPLLLDARHHRGAAQGRGAGRPDR